MVVVLSFSCAAAPLRCDAGVAAGEPIVRSHTVSESSAGLRPQSVRSPR
ncbi:hypothetical protein ACFPRL_21375 [Pseudoclavibacter helvolus]